MRARDSQASIFCTVRRVLVVDDEENLRLVLRTLLRRHGYEVETAASGEEALGLVDSFGPDVVLTDVRMPKMGGLDLLATLKAKGNDATVIVMSAYGNLDLAIEAMTAGAYDYVQKPFKPEEVVLALRKAEERESLRRENRVLREEIRRENKFEDILAKSEKMQEIFRTIAKIAEYKTTVLVTGESGVGKELVARALHYNGPRQKHAFVSENCAAIPTNLMESEFFGYVRGAFTGATADKMGLFEVADGGTLFLDEIGDMDLDMQTKLLRVLQDGVLRRVGSKEFKRVDVRLVSATNRDLLGLIKEGRFREDLYYRLNVFPLRVPALRERRRDILPLARAVLARAARGRSGRAFSLSAEAESRLTAYTWKGNIRELENVMQRAMILAPGASIEVEHLCLPGGDAASDMARTGAPAGIAAPAAPKPLPADLKSLERAHILDTLASVGGVRKAAAERLKMSERTLRYKLAQYRLEGAVGKEGEA